MKINHDYMNLFLCKLCHRLNNIHEIASQNRNIDVLQLSRRRVYCIPYQICFTNLESLHPSIFGYKCFLISFYILFKCGISQTKESNMIAIYISVSIIEEQIRQ